MVAKSKRTRKNYHSKGIVGINKGLSKAVREERSLIDKDIDKIDAFKAGKRVYFTIENPNKGETNRLFIRQCYENKRLVK